jgi:DNA-binding MarR family transcriptional regulator
MNTNAKTKAAATSNGANPSLAALRRAGFDTISEAIIALEIVRAEQAGKPHNVRSLANAVGIPYTSVARLAYQFVERGFGHQEHAPNDRRRRYLRADLTKFAKAVR